MSIEDAIKLHGATEIVLELEESIIPASGEFLTELPPSLRSAFLRFDPFSSEVQPATGTLDPTSFFPRLGVAVGYIDESGLSVLSKSRDVRAIHQAADLDMILGASPVPTSCYEGNWGIDALAVTGLWSAGLSGDQVRICHLDTGVDINHPTLRGRVIECVEITSDGSVAIGAGGDENGHGTHTAATIVGGAEEGPPIGIAPGARLHCAKIVGSESKRRLLGGLQWAIDTKSQIVSISMGVVGYQPFLEGIFERVLQAGLIPVVAIGNEGPGSSRSPGNYSSALSVGAMDRDFRVWKDSSSTTLDRVDEPTQPDVIAPGVEIVSAQLGGGCRKDTGTSQATPFVSGLAALLRQAWPTASSSLIIGAIKNTAKLYPGMSAARCGLGVIQPAAALEYLRANGS